MGAGASAGVTPSDVVKEMLIVKPKVEAPLDPDFAPVILAKKAYKEAAKDCTDELNIALPRRDGVARYNMKVFPDGDAKQEASVAIACVIIQELIWQRSAASLQLAGPAGICGKLKEAFAVGGAFEFEATSMPKVNGTPDKPFEVTIVEVGALPEASDTPQECGKEASGNRLAFDLGKSDIKTVCVKDGEVLESAETEWDVTNVDPQYHFDAITKAMKDTLEKAKAKGFGEIQAVGGSATGTVSGDNEATWCDIFPNVPQDVMRRRSLTSLSELRRMLLATYL